jgi:DNA-binding transcriptional LysR family regulator
VRDGQRMLLSPRAAWIRPKVRMLLREIEQTFGDPPKFDAATSKCCFRILENDYAIAVVLSRLLEFLQRHAPDVTMEILPLEDHFLERLAEGDYDLAIRDRWSLRTARRIETLFKRTLFASRGKITRVWSKRPTLAEFLAEGHVISPQGRTPGIVDAPLKRLKRRRRVAVTLPHFFAGPAIVATTDFVMTIPRRLHGGIQSCTVCGCFLRLSAFPVLRS